MLQIICIIFLINIGVNIEADIYRATSDLVHLVDAHKTIKDYLYEYLERYTRRLTILKSYLNIFKAENEKAVADFPTYSDNQINIFTLIKRLTIDIIYLNSSIEDESEYIEDIIFKNHFNQYPTKVDLVGAAEALVRLQHLYNLKVKDLAEGKLDRMANSTPMTAGDCYELGRVFYKEADFWNGISWMLEAFRKYKVEDVLYPFTEINIIEQISYGYSEIEDMESALQWIQKVMEIDPQNYRAKAVAQHCKNKISLEKRYSSMEYIIQKEERKRQERMKAYELLNDPLCRYDVEMPSEVSSRLTCRYMTENHPFLKIAPFKIEMLYLNPDIVLFHDVMSDIEIEDILEMSRKRLQSSGIANMLIKSKKRISKTAWLSDSLSFLVDRISRRVSHMTGLSLDNAEDIQVANYGIGGFYTTHHDFLELITLQEEFEIGDDRIATVLFYLSDVTQGGATIFTDLGLKVLPKKGSAIYWFNLHASGEPNYCLQHAACPVLQGSKWVATKWIHKIDQAFTKPCNLQNHVADCTRLPFPTILNTFKTDV